MQAISPLKGMSIEDLRFLVESIGIPEKDKRFWSDLTTTQKLKRLANRSQELDVATLEKTRYFQLVDGAFLIIPGKDAQTRAESPWRGPLPAIRIIIKGGGITLKRCITLPPEGEIAWCVDDAEGYSSEQEEAEARLKLLEVYVEVMRLIKERIKKD